MINVLFTSVGRRVELVRAFQQTLRTLDMAGLVSGTDKDPLAPALHVVDRPHLVPSLESEGYLPALARVCRMDAIDLIFPLIDPDIPILAAGAEYLAETGARVGVMSPASVAIINDKWLTFEFFRRVGVPTPETWLPSQGVPSESPFPLFIKPRRGSASEGTFKLRDERELAFFTRYVQDPVVQEYASGPEITNDLFVDLSGNILGVVSRKRISVRQGEVAKGVTVKDDRIRDHCVSIAMALEAVGPITVQCIMHEGNPLFTEVNGRLAGGSPLALAAGCDFPTLLLKSITGATEPSSNIGDYRSDVFLSRFDNSLILEETDVSALEGSRIRP